MYMHRAALVVCIVSAAELLIGSFAQAAVITPVSYDMLNGMSGYWATQGQGGYWDETYSGSGDPLADLSPLTGGLGQLTDGVLGDPPVPIINVSYKWVGWQQNNPLHAPGFQPSITFAFAQAFAFDEVSFYVDNGGRGDVFVFGAVHLSFSDDGLSYGAPVSYTSTPAERANRNAIFVDVPLAGFGRFVRADFDYIAGVTLDPRGPWLFLSEVTFQGHAVPEPASVGLWLLLHALILGPTFVRKNALILPQWTYRATAYRDGDGLDNARRSEIELTARPSRSAVNLLVVVAGTSQVVRKFLKYDRCLINDGFLHPRPQCKALIRNRSAAGVRPYLVIGYSWKTSS